MQKSEYQNIYKNEKDHFYYVGYRKIIISLLKNQFKNNSTKLKILDAGCGAGLLTKELRQFGDVTGMDISSEAIKFTRRRGIKVVKGTISKIPFKDNTFDFVSCIDVLCHKSIDNDVAALKELRRVLKEDGILLLKLPAYSWLYGSHDKHVFSKKRYDLNNVIKDLKASKLPPLKTTYVGSFLIIPSILKAFIEKMKNPTKSVSNVNKVWPPLNSLLIFLFKIECFLGNHIDIPFGISILTISKK